MAKDYDNTSTPKSVQEQAAPAPVSQVTTTVNAGAISGAGVLRSQDKAREQVARKELQIKLDAAGLRLNKETTVIIRAMKTHHPAPRVGTFNFQDVYNCFIEGMKYRCPKDVALYLEETENATILG